MHRQLAEYLHSGRLLLSQEEVARALEETAWMRETAGRIEREGRRYWTLKYLEGKQGEEMEAVVLERRGGGYLVELCDCRLKGSIHGSNELWAVPGDRMRVRVGQVSARRDLVRLGEVREG
jgi:exoribonuclease R